MAWFGEFWIQSRLNREGISSFMSCITSVTRYRQFAAPVTYWWCLERWVRKVTQLTQKVEFRFRKQRKKGKKYTKNHRSTWLGWQYLDSGIPRYRKWNFDLTPKALTKIFGIYLPESHLAVTMFCMLNVQTGTSAKLICQFQILMIYVRFSECDCQKFR